MNKIKKTALSLAVAAMATVSLTACTGNVKTVSGLTSKIEKCAIVFDVDGTETEINFELYMNFAPTTIEHFKYLASNGYYDGTVVSNAAANSFFEFGEYGAGENGEYLSKYEKDAEYADYYDYITDAYVAGKKVGERAAYRGKEHYLIGEFSQNGITLGEKSKANPLGLTGSLVMKRVKQGDSDDYNTARGGVAVTFSTGSYYDSASDFAVFGKIIDEDIEKAKGIIDGITSDDDGNKYYYYDFASKKTDYEYFMKNEDGEIYAKDEEGEYKILIEDEEVLDEFKDNAAYFMLVTRKTVKVKSITFSK